MNGAIATKEGGGAVVLEDERESFSKASDAATNNETMDEATPGGGILLHRSCRTEAEEDSDGGGSDDALGDGVCTTTTTTTAETATGGSSKKVGGAASLTASLTTTRKIVSALALLDSDCELEADDDDDEEEEEEKSQHKKAMAKIEESDEQIKARAKAYKMGSTLAFGEKDTDLLQSHTSITLPADLESDEIAAAEADQELPPGVVGHCEQETGSKSPPPRPGMRHGAYCQAPGSASYRRSSRYVLQQPEDDHQHHQSNAETTQPATGGSKVRMNVMAENSTTDSGLWTMKQAAAHQQQQEPQQQRKLSIDSVIIGGEVLDMDDLIQAYLVDEQDRRVSATIATAQPVAHRDLIRKQSASETARVRKWRACVFLSLLATALAVTVSTYMLLVDREKQNFKIAYGQFSRTLGDAALEQQTILRKSLRMFSDYVSVTSHAISSATTATHIVSANGQETYLGEDENGANSTRLSLWPYFVVPQFEMLAANFKNVANAEFVGLQNYVEHHQRDSYVAFITKRYQNFVQESHWEAYGTLDNLNQNTSLYQPYIAQKLTNGSFVEDTDRDYYFCYIHQSPPPRKYGPVINRNMMADQVIADGFHAVLELRSEPIFTTIKPFSIIPANEHARMHSNGAEGANNPHTFVYQPVHEIPHDYSSRIVAMLTVATAWDFSMMNLLPDNVRGIYCVVENTCNQTVTYRVDGGNATYLGEGELIDYEYKHMGALFVDLNLQEHPNASSTPGHCQYSMRIYPSKDLEDDYRTSTPAVYAALVAGTFAIIGFLHLLYDWSVSRRNKKMIANAAKTSSILAKLFPDNIRNRIMGFEDDGACGNSEDHV